MTVEHNPGFDKCIILHGCPPNETTVTPLSNRWMNWIAEKLVDAGYDAVAPELPTAWEPVYEEWKKVFEQYSITENTLLVAHSCGAAFLVRWLQEKQMTINKLILVAPAKVPETPDDKRQVLYQFDLTPKTAKVAKEVVIFSSNDFPHHLKSLEMYKKAFPNAKVVTLENKGHFLFFQTNTNEFPELLDEILPKTV
jgi:uncharacterized protein